MMKSLTVIKHEHVDLGNAAQLYTVPNFIPYTISGKCLHQRTHYLEQADMKFNRFTLQRMRRS
jgi:hypothetical protein